MGSWGAQLLQRAVASDDQHVACALLEADPKLAKLSGPDGNPLLITAASRAEAEVVAVLLRLGVPADVVDSVGRTALYYIATDDDLDL